MTNRNSEASIKNNDARKKAMSYSKYLTPREKEFYKGNEEGAGYLKYRHEKFLRRKEATKWAQQVQSNSQEPRDQGRV